MVALVDRISWKLSVSQNLEKIILFANFANEFISRIANNNMTDKIMLLVLSK